MTAKEFFRRFRWGAICPPVLYLIIGIMTAAMYPKVFPSDAVGYAYEFICAVLALFAGAIAVLYYFLGRDESVFSLLSGVGALSVAIYLFVPTLVKWSIVPIALGVSLVLHAASECYRGIRERKGSKVKLVARIAFAAVFAALGVVACVRPFATTADDWVFTGVSYLSGALVMFVFALTGGLFEEEEELKFRAVKQERGGAAEQPAEEGGEEPAEKDGGKPGRGARKR